MLRESDKSLVQKLGTGGTEDAVRCWHLVLAFLFFFLRSYCHFTGNAFADGDWAVRRADSGGTGRKESMTSLRVPWAEVVGNRPLP